MEQGWDTSAFSPIPPASSYAVLYLGVLVLLPSNLDQITFIITMATGHTTAADILVGAPGGGVDEDFSGAFGDLVDPSLETATSGDIGVDAPTAAAADHAHLVGRPRHHQA